MGDDKLVRSSAILSLFDAMLHSSIGSYRVVELIGRGIAADARCTQAVFRDKMTVSSERGSVALQRATEAADLLVGLGAIEGELAEMWRRCRAGDLDESAFEAALDGAVRRLEAWPAQWSTTDLA